MAELRCTGLAKSYGTRVVLADVDLVVPGGNADGDPRRVGQRQDDAAAHDHRVHRRRQGNDHGRRQRRRRGGQRRRRRPTNARSATSPRRARCSRTSPSPRTSPSACPAPSASAARIGEALELVGLRPGLREPPPPRALRRRAAPGRARAGARATPALVLLDEPFSGLDAALRVGDARGGLNALAGEGTTAVLVTHDQAEALSMGREVARAAGRPARPDGDADRALPGSRRSRRGAFHRRCGRSARARGRRRRRLCARQARRPQLECRGARCK